MLATIRTGALLDDWWQSKFSPLFQSSSCNFEVGTSSIWHWIIVCVTSMRFTLAFAFFACASSIFPNGPLLRYISEKVVRSLAVGAVPVMWSRVAGWEKIIPGPLAAVFVEDFGFDALKLVQALEAEAHDPRLYMRVTSLCIQHV